MVRMVGGRGWLGVWMGEREFRFRLGRKSLCAAAPLWRSAAVAPAAPAAKPSQATRGGVRDLLYLGSVDILAPERGSKYWPFVGSTSQLMWSCAR